MLKRTLFVFITVALVIFASCGCDLENHSASSCVVMTYNVQDLFDAYVCGTEYPEFTPEQGWSTEQYKERLRRTARAITQEHGLIPDIVVLQEIENEQVVEDLLREHLGKRGFQWYAVSHDRETAIQTGIISRFPITAVRLHGVINQRSLLEATFHIEGEEIVLFALHGKSNLGGVEESEDKRLATAKALASLSENLLKTNPALPIIIAGDFNQSADTFKRNNCDYQTALVPYDVMESEAYRKAGSLIVRGSPSTQDWYTWWLDREFLLKAKAQGSYWYDGVWETFDQILLSPAFFDNRGVEFKSGQVGASDYLCDAKGRPQRWDIKNGTGVSDHLPVYVELAFY